MKDQFKAITLSYKNAPIAIREAVALNEAGCRSLLHKIKEFTGVQDAMVLSTCNRTEVYYASGQELSTEIIKLIAIEKGFIATKNIQPFFRVLNHAEEAYKHLFHVALGLESQVTGDVQILNQVKIAYKWAAEENMAGPVLHRLLHTIFATNKRVVNETAFHDGAASVSYATLELVEELTRQIENPRVLMIGVGEIGADVCRNFKKSKLENIIITNRTYSKAEALAEECMATAAPYENLWEEINKADVVISSVPGDCLFVSKAEIEKMGQPVYKFFIDLSMPRSIDPALETMPGVFVYNVDSIRNKATEALERRMAAIPEVKNIVVEAIAEFQQWTREMSVSPAIQQFKQKLEDIRNQELARYVKKMNDQEKELVEAVTRNMLQKILKAPVLELKAACLRGESETLLESLSALFDLEKETV
ncbi:glutamyl-tRNA reductase [Adhaeribacter sp. BT258]|uniref:Glutamyl-tRNA reductase n=1 Tax=Adhaeribacter terrigena TaxID=2793070 RepID=A0ABS1BZ17_9BACT|nr:glutamyl-tRNA reductase [Adhaeribacter terrigena]MBK0402418.1 glutamyl-tRNA reductase [Adhaeribacter terrigena]